MEGQLCEPVPSPSGVAANTTVSVVCLTVASMKRVCDADVPVDSSARSVKRSCTRPVAMPNDSAVLLGQLHAALGWKRTLPSPVALDDECETHLPLFVRNQLDYNTQDDALARWIKWNRNATLFARDIDSASRKDYWVVRHRDPTTLYLPSLMYREVLHFYETVRLRLRSRPAASTNARAAFADSRRRAL